MGMFQTVGSNLRYGVLEVARQRTVAAAGTGQTDATAVGGGGLNVVTGSSGTNGVRLPKGKNPHTFWVYSSAATNAMLVYPPTGGTINNGTANAALSVAARKPVQFACLIDGITWMALVGS